MSDLDAFDRRFAAAYRRYLDEAETEVDAAAIARSVAGDTRRRRAGIGGWPLRSTPAGSWLVVVVALLAATLVGAYLIGTRLPQLPVVPVASQPASPAPSGWAGLMGTWSDPGEQPTVLTLHPCGLGEVCGRFERFDDYKERCVYTLEHRPPVGDTFVYWSITANSFGCAWGGPVHVEFHVQPEAGDAVRVWYEVDGTPRRAWNLSLVSAVYEPQLPPTIVGAWSSTGRQEVLRLAPCGPGEWCGSLTLLRAGQECSYTLMYRPKTYDEYVFWVASASGAPCDTSGWRHTTLLVRPSAVGQVVLSHDPGVEFTLFEPGYEPGSSASPPPGG